MESNTESDVEPSLLISYLRSVKSAIKSIASREILKIQYPIESFKYTDDSLAKIDLEIEECLLELKVQVNTLVEYNNRQSDFQLNSQASLVNLADLDVSDREMYHIAYHGKTETDVFSCGDLFYPSDIAATNLWQIDEQSRLNN